MYRLQYFRHSRILKQLACVIGLGKPILFQYYPSFSLENFSFLGIDKIDREGGNSGTEKNDSGHKISLFKR